MVGSDGKDIIASEIRDDIKKEIEDNENELNGFFYVLLYTVVLCYTVSFGFQYIKRVVFVAFLILISPLIALTYPLDKLKDGKAQAFEEWLKEFVFNVLLQIVHLLLYFLLITLAGDLATDNKIYALVAMGALVPAEKFIRKLFGLETSTSMGTMASALGGAAIMNGINKLGSIGGKGGQAQSSNDNTKVRMSEPVQNGGQGTSSQNIQTTTERTDAKTKDLQVGDNREIKSKPSTFKGVWRVARKYVLNKNTGKKLLRGTAKIAGAATLGTIGLAAGIATGEEKNVLAGTLGGITAGKKLGGNIVDTGADFISGAKNTVKGVVDTYNKGKSGEKEEIEEKNKDESDNKQKEVYTKLMEKYSGQEKNIKEFINSGINDTGKIEIALKNIKDGKYDVKTAITYIRLSETSSDVMMEENKFKNYCISMGIPEEQIEDLRKCILEFK